MVKRMNDPYVYFLSGNQSYQQGDYKSAIENYDRFVSAIGKAAGHKPYYLRGNAKVAKGDYEGAIEDYNSAWEGIIANPDDGSDRWPILFNRGNAQAALGRYEEALQDYNEAARFDPDFTRWWILFNQGNAKAALGRYKEALRDYHKAAQLARETHSESLTGMVFFNQANVKTILGKYEEAIRDYGEAVRLATTGVEKNNARFNKGNVLVMSGRFHEAWQCYNESVREGGSSVVRNRKYLEGVLQSTGGARSTIETEPGPYGQVRVVVTVNDGSHGDSRGSREFGFDGNVGSTGNVGGMLSVPSGEGYPGGPPFCVQVKTGNPPPQPGPTPT